MLLAVGLGIMMILLVSSSPQVEMPTKTIPVSLKTHMQCEMVSLRKDKKIVRCYNEEAACYIYRDRDWSCIKR